MDDMESKTVEEPKRLPGEVEENSIKLEIREKTDLDAEVLSDEPSDNVGKSSNHSEYESIESEGSVNEDEMVERHSENEDVERESENDAESENEGSVGLEREEGDGQESAPAKKVDDDEDKKNPQYIPKRGTFYEHDDRTLDESEKQETNEKPEKQTKKNIWMEKKERWGHDRYNDNEQAPKSKSELVAIYGYDIRNEDGPPRARRRRRYGRGPNKYTRTWEDEEAYKPIKPVISKPKSKNQEEYPSLSRSNRQSNGDPDSEDYGNSTDSRTEEYQNQNRYSSEGYEDSSAVNEAPQNPSRRNEQLSNRSQHHRVGTGRIVKPKPEVKREIMDADYRGFTKTRQYRNSKSEQKVLPKPHRNDHSQLVSKANVQELERDLNRMNIQDGGNIKSRSNSQRQSSVPPRLQNEQKGSKRYSSLRQRSLPETTAPPFSQGGNYYSNDYPQAQVAQVQQQALLAQPTSIRAPSTPQVPQIAPPPLPAIPPPVPTAAAPILQAPPQFAAAFPQPQPFLPPAVPPPPFLPQPPPPLINFVQGQQFPQPAPYQGYQHQQFNAVTQPAELYSCQGGTTYYSTQNQHIVQRVVPQKRPKAAIPIIPPPPQEPRGRGRTSNARETSLYGEDMCENITSDIGCNYEDAVVVQQ